MSDLSQIYRQRLAVPSGPWAELGAQNLKLSGLYLQALYPFPMRPLSSDNSQGSGWPAPDVSPNQGQHPVGVGTLQLPLPDLLFLTIPLADVLKDGRPLLQLATTARQPHLMPANDVGGGGRGSPRGSLGVSGIR